jgi:hypothetical protein
MSGYAQTFEFSFATAAPLPPCSGEDCAIQTEPVLNGLFRWSSPLPTMNNWKTAIAVI